MKPPPASPKVWGFALRGAETQVVRTTAQTWYYARQKALAKLSRLHSRAVEPSHVVCVHNPCDRSDG